MTAALVGVGQFAGAYAQLDSICGWLSEQATAGLTHGEVEDELATRGRELLRTLLQDHLDLLCLGEERVEVVDADDRLAALQQPFGHMHADETRCSGDDDGHDAQPRPMLV